MNKATAPCAALECNAGTGAAITTVVSGSEGWGYMRCSAGMRTALNLHSNHPWRLNTNTIICASSLLGQRVVAPHAVNSAGRLKESGSCFIADHRRPP